MAYYPQAQPIHINLKKKKVFTEKEMLGGISETWKLPIESKVNTEPSGETITDFVKQLRNHGNELHHYHTRGNRFFFRNENGGKFILTLSPSAAKEYRREMKGKNKIIFLNTEDLKR